MGGNDKNNPRAHYVRPPIKLMQYITDYLNNSGYTVLQFGPKLDYWVGNIPTFTPLKGAIHIRNLEIREQAACFSVAKNMICGDSGLSHLNLAVGGKSVVFHPPESTNFGYLFYDLHYLSELWKNEPVRVKYIDFTQFNGKMEEIMGFLDGI